MTPRIGFALSAAAALLATCVVPSGAPACCPAPPSGKPVVNADQSVIMIWDATAKTQHFIRQASFQSDADDFGFLVPTPTQPALDEAGNEAFPFLHKLTEPETKLLHRPSGGMGCGCSRVSTKSAAPAAEVVKVLEEKLVAGLHAVVLQADSADALVDWLKERGYAYSPRIKAWAKPYVQAGWKITALKVAKDELGDDRQENKKVTAAALRLTFKTDRPIFPYREPDSKSAAEALGVKQRLLRIYFLADARYQGNLTKEVPWTGQVAWSGKLDVEDRQKAIELLKLPESTGPAEWWLTEFEDNWPYEVAPADVVFSRDPNQATVKRPPIIQYISAAEPVEAMAYALAAVVALPPLVRRVCRARNGARTK